MVSTSETKDLINFIESRNLLTLLDVEIAEELESEDSSSSLVIQSPAPLGEAVESTSQSCFELATPKEELEEGEIQQGECVLLCQSSLGHRPSAIPISPDSSQQDQYAQHPNSTFACHPPQLQFHLPRPPPTLHPLNSSILIPSNHNHRPRRDSYTNHNQISHQAYRPQRNYSRQPQYRHPPPLRPIHPPVHFPNYPPPLPTYPATNHWFNQPDLYPRHSPSYINLGQPRCTTAVPSFDRPAEANRHPSVPAGSHSPSSRDGSPQVLTTPVANQYPIPSPLIEPSRVSQLVEICSDTDLVHEKSHRETPSRLESLLSSTKVHNPFSSSHSSQSSKDPLSRSSSAHSDTPGTSTSASFELNPSATSFRPFVSFLGDDQSIIYSTIDQVKSLFAYEYKAAEPFPEAQIIAPIPIQASKKKKSKKRRTAEKERAEVEFLLDSTEDLLGEGICDQEEESSITRSEIQEVGTREVDILVDLEDEMDVERIISGDSGNGGPPGAKYQSSQLPESITDLRSDFQLTSESSSTPAPLEKPFANSARHGPSTTSAYARLLAQPSARQTVPLSLLDNSDPLRMTVLQSWVAAEPDAAKRAAVRRLLERLSYHINLRLGGAGALIKGERRFEVDVFGSVSWGGETGHSGDLDLVILDRQQPQGYHPGIWRTPPGEDQEGGSAKPAARHFVPIPNQPACHDLNRLANLLRTMGMKSIQCIYNASTPIVKFVDTAEGFDLECDLNFNDLGGWYNSSLILRYCEISPHVLRPMIHALKRWSKAHGINDPSGKNGPSSMSSYCLVLLAIGYLQIQGQLPNLQADIEVPIPSYPADVEDPDLIWVGWGKLQGTPCHVAFAEQSPPGWKPADSNYTVGDAIRGFFSYFDVYAPSEAGVPQFDRQSEIISILNGGLLTRAHAIGQSVTSTKAERIAAEPFMGTGKGPIQPINWKDRRLVVQDPFIWQKNCTQAMSGVGVDKWLNAVSRTNDIIRAKGIHATFNDLLDALPGAALPSSPMRGRGSPRPPSRGHSPLTRGGSPIFARGMRLAQQQNGGRSLADRIS